MEGGKVSEPKFKFGDKVRITSGFYRGVVGIVKYCDLPFRLFKKREWRYYIEPQSNEIRNKMTRSESGLEIVDEAKP
jgi:hypothetical protein